MKKLALVIVGLLVVGAVYFSVQKSNKAAKGNVENENGPIFDAKENLLKLTSGGGEPHYKCPNECENSGAEGAGTCPSCGTAYVHNQAFHGASGNPLGLNDSPLPVIDPSSGKATEIGKATATPISTSTTTTATTNSDVMHYTCKQGHGGTNTKDQTCGTCGNPYEHNPAYHNNSASATPSSPQITTSTSSPSISASPALPSAAGTSASSASGVMHYTCSKGDGGGSNVRTEKCGKCGGELAHNEAFHS